MARKQIEDGQPISKRTMYRRRRAAGLTQPVFRYPFNDKFIDHWTDDLAWLLGIIWSDGCLFGNSIEICSKDNDLMELVEGIIEMPNGIRLKNKGRALRIVFTSKYVADWLRELGLTEAKSLTANFPLIPEPFQGAFVRGILDGDGSVREKKWRKGQQAPDIVVEWFGASPYLHDGLLDWLHANEIKTRDRISHGIVWHISVQAIDSLRRLHSLLYAHEGVSCLFRKGATYQHWLETPRTRPGRPKN